MKIRSEDFIIIANSYSPENNTNIVLYIFIAINVYTVLFKFFYKNIYFYISTIQIASYIFINYRLHNS